MITRLRVWGLRFKGLGLGFLQRLYRGYSGVILGLDRIM